MAGSAVENLVQELLAMRQRINAQLTQAFNGVPEEAAGRRPAPDAWSMKDTLAHLVINERQNVAWLAEMVRLENPSLIDVWTEALPQKIAAVQAVAPHSLALLSLLFKEQWETLAFMSTLKDTDLERTGNWMGEEMTVTELARGIESHYNLHLNQIRETRQAVEGD